MLLKMFVFKYNYLSPNLFVDVWAIIESALFVINKLLFDTFSTYQRSAYQRTDTPLFGSHAQ